MENKKDTMGIDLGKKQIRTFGLVLAVILTIFGLLKIYKGQATFSLVLLALGITSAASALFFQPLIKPVFIVATKVSHVLGWINTRIILGFIFYVLITPISLIMRVFGKDFLNERIEPNKESYWIKREKIPFDKSRYEKQF